MSQREWRDHPQVQLLLERRDLYQKADALLEAAKEKWDEVGHSEDLSPRDVAATIRALGQLAADRQAHLEAMEITLAQLRKEFGSHLNTLAKLVSDFAKIQQQWAMHREKLESKLGDEDDIPDEDL